MKKELVEDIIQNLKETNKFKSFYKNTVPVWTNIRRFPAIAVLYESEEKVRDNLTNRKAYYIGHIAVFIFNKQAPNKYDDILSDYIELVYSVIENIRWHKYNIVDATVSSMKREGGIVHPYAIAKIDIEVRYIKEI
jgi:hypothetical protein